VLSGSPNLLGSGTPDLGIAVYPTDTGTAYHDIFAINKTPLSSWQV